MSSVNKGNQKVTYSYGERAESAIFNTINYKLLPKGIYQGALLSKVTNDSAAIAPGVFYLEDTTEELGVRVETTETYTLTSADPATPVLVIRFSWVATGGNYADFFWRSVGGVETDDIVLGQAGFSGSDLDGTFDYSARESVSFITAAIAEAQFLTQANNLSDLDNTTIARDNLGLGTAAVVDTQTSVYDSTDDVALLKGAFGLGGQGTLATLVDADSVANPTGFYRIDPGGNTSSGTSPGTSEYTVLIISEEHAGAISGNKCSQLAMDVEDGRLYFRSFNGPGGTDWTPWRELYHSGNTGTAALADISTYGETLIDDADASTARATLELGASDVVNFKAANEDVREFDTATTTTHTILDTDENVFAVDTSTADFTFTLPTLADNLGRKLYLINVTGTNDILFQREGSDVIGPDGDTSVTAASTTTIIVGTSDYWSVVETGGGGSGAGGGMEIGTIYPYAGTAAPVGSLLCDGSAYSRTEYADLFAAIGTLWGAGDGSTTFNLPDLRGAFPRGTGSHGSATMANGSPYAGPAVGATQDDQMQGHRHDISPMVGEGDTGGSSSSDSYDPTSGWASKSIKVEDPKSDGVNGTPRTGDETRPFAAGVTYCIKATPATNSGTPLPTYSYSTGWVANSDWTNAEFLVTHGLNAPLSDLVVKFFIRDVSGDELEVIGGTGLRDDELAGATERGGLGAFAIDNSSFKIQTGTDGFFYPLDSAGQLQRAITNAQATHYLIKVYRPEVLATELATTKYDTGWVANSAWNSAEISVVHNLGSPLSELVVRFFISTDGTEGNAFEPQMAARTNTDGTVDNNLGHTFKQISDNEIEVWSGSDGFIAIGPDDHDLTGIDNESWYYRVVVYKPELISSATPAAVKSVSADYTITGRTDSRTIQVTTGATDRTITLPAGTGLIPGDEFEVNKVDAGAGKVTVARAGSDTIDGVTSVDIDSQYDLARVRWTGSYFTLTEYKDHGSNANGDWVRWVDGTMNCEGTVDLGGTTAGSWTFPVPFAVEPRNNYSAGAAGAGSSSRLVYVAPNNTTDAFVGSSNTANNVDVFITGRWRA